jgi:hypothetical protein
MLARMSSADVTQQMAWGFFCECQALPLIGSGVGRFPTPGPVFKKADISRVDIVRPLARL